jgi:hypothetical protein
MYSWGKTSQPAWIVEINAAKGQIHLISLHRDGILKSIEW